MKSASKILTALLCCSTALSLSISRQAVAGGSTSASDRTPPSETPTTPRDGFASLLDYEAQVALSQGKLRRAWTMLHRLVDVEPNNMVAWRDLGRTCAALGELSTAVEILEMVDQRRDRTPDPELHFIRGEALIALGKRTAGLQELAVAETQLSGIEPTHQVQMWRARIYALRGNAEDAIRLYREALRPGIDEAERRGILINMAETYVLAREWAKAEITLRSILSRWPDDERARDMLGWTLEASGELDEEVEVRAKLADRLSTRPAQYAAAHARALERSFSFEPALQEYRRARGLGVDVDTAIERLEGQLAPEVAAHASVRSDPLGDSYRARAGASIPLRTGLRLTTTAAVETIVSAQSATNQDGPRRLLVGYLLPVVQFGAGHQIAAGIGAWHSDTRGSQLGGRVVMRTSPTEDWRVLGHADVNAPWRDSTATMKHGGEVSGLELQFYRSLFEQRIIAMAGGRARRLSLAMTGPSPTVTATQLFGVAGVDVVISRGSSAAARGQLLDSEMLADDQLASGVSLGYRHYETQSNNPFGQRLALVKRSRIDELSFAAGQVIDDRGILSLQARSGLGYDNARDAWLWRAAVRMDLSLTISSRLSTSIEAFQETTTGITGRTLIAQVGLHVDL